MVGFDTNNAPITKLLHSEFWKKVSMSHVKNVPIPIDLAIIVQNIAEISKNSV